MSKIEVNQISSQCGSTLTIGQSGDGIQLACGATQTGFGRTGTVNWDTTAKTASFTAVSGNGYFVNTTSTAITVTLPAGSAGSIVSLKDYANTWQTNNVTVTPNGTDKINGINSYALLDTQDQSITLVYVDDTKGWRAVQDSTSDVSGATFIVATGGTITTSGNFKIHTFTSPGTFCVSQVATAPANNEVSYVVVAGGGAGQHNYGGGGGAGGFRESKSGVDCYSASPLEGATNISVTATAFPITVGAGGAYASSPGTTKGNSGSNSVFSTITSAGGGGGGVGANCTLYAGVAGGSGGGGGSPAPGCAGSNSCGGAGNTPSVTPAQGNPGGNGSRNPSTHTYGGGGGGAIQAGINAGHPIPDNPTGGDGGDGATTSISASPTAYAGGGGGARNNTGPNTTGGSGGGGRGANVASPTTPGTAGTANTGGGGGAGASTGSEGGSGGSGIVIIRYKYQ